MTGAGYVGIFGKRNASLTVDRYRPARTWPIMISSTSMFIWPILPTHPPHGNFYFLSISDPASPEHPFIVTVTDPPSFALSLSVVLSSFMSFFLGGKICQTAAHCHLSLSEGDACLKSLLPCRSCISGLPAPEKEGHRQCTTGRVGPSAILALVSASLLQATLPSTSTVQPCIIYPPIPPSLFSSLQPHGLHELLVQVAVQVPHHVPHHGR